MKDKLVKLIDDYTESLSAKDMHKADFAEKFADYLLANGFGMVSGRHTVGYSEPCKLGDSVFVPFLNEENGVIYMDEFKITEISHQRIWVNGDDGFDYEISDIGKEVFLSFDSAKAFFEEQGMTVERGKPAMAVDLSELQGVERPLCAVGDTVYEVFMDDDGKVYVDEVKVMEVSTQRIWVDSNYYDYDDVGKSIFLHRDDVDKYLQSPEYLAQRINKVLQFNVSNEAKKELLVGAFEAGQEYFEKDTDKYIKLTHTGPSYIWHYDVFDSNKELLYNTSYLAVRLAMDILEGYIVPAAMAKEKSVDGLISEAVDVAKQNNQDIECAQQDFTK